MANFSLTLTARRRVALAAAVAAAVAVASALVALPLTVRSLVGAPPPGPAARREPPLLPLALLLAKPRVLAAKLAPDGSAIAVVERAGPSTAVALYGPAGEPRHTVYADTAQAVNNVRWSADGRWLLVLQDRGGDEGYHLLRLDPRQRGGRAVDLTPFPGAQVDLVALPPARPDVAVVTSNHRDPRASDAYVVALATGAVRRVARNPGDVTAYAATDRGEVLAATAITADGVLEVRTRAREADAFRAVYRVGPAERAAMLGFIGTPRRLVLRSNRGAAYATFRFLDPATGAVRATRASRCTGFDADTLHTTDTGTILGEQCTAAAPAFVAADPRLDALVARLVRRGDTTRAVEFEGRTRDGGRLLFYTHGATDPGRFVLLDAAAGTARALFASRPALDTGAFAQDLAPTGFHWFRARDGLRLSALLTPSPVAPGRPQPAVVVVHGGPWTRDALGFSGETQLLANRGYAVLQVNFRGSTGLGRATVDGAVGEFGGRMSDDLLDAVAWAAARGAVDPARVCVLGGSYGGFAALVALTRDAARFRCGVDYAGPVDLETLIRSFPPSWGPFLPRSWYRFVGRPDRPADRTRMRRRSPAAMLDSARAPLLVFHGANDPRVRSDQAARVARAWAARGVPHTLLYADKEGHGFNEEITALAVTRAAEEFLGRWLGGRVEAVPPAGVREAIAALRRAGTRLVGE